MKLLPILLSLLCGLASAQDLNTNGLIVRRAANASDGYMGGVNIYRDASALVGGIPWNVNVANYTRTTVGEKATTFEWNILGIMDNSATEGQNVAGYFQGNKLSTGPTWGSVSEVSDTVGAGGAALGVEIDNFTTGPDNGYRLGLDVVGGDARINRNLPGGGNAQLTTGMRVSAIQGATWANGVILRDFRGAGLVLQSTASPVRGIWFQGPYTVGLDMGDVTGQTAIRLHIGSRITFDQYDQYGVHQDPVTQDLIFDNAGTMLMRLTPGGHLYLAGKLHEGQ